MFTPTSVLHWEPPTQRLYLGKKGCRGLRWGLDLRDLEFLDKFFSKTPQSSADLIITRQWRVRLGSLPLGIIIGDRNIYYKINTVKSLYNLLHHSHISSSMQWFFFLRIWIHIEFQPSGLSCYNPKGQTFLFLPTRRHWPQSMLHFL